MKNFSYGLPAGPAPLFGSAPNAAPRTNGHAMLEAAKSTVGILQKQRPDDTNITLTEIADQLFDGSTTLARQLVDGWDIPTDGDTLNRDLYETMLASAGIPPDIERAYANAATVSVQRVASDFFAGDINAARAWAMDNKQYPQPGGRYSREPLEDALDSKVFTEAARQYARKQNKRRMKFMAENCTDANDRRYRKKLAAELEQIKPEPLSMLEAAVMDLPTEQPASMKNPEHRPAMRNIPDPATERARALAQAMNGVSISSHRPVRMEAVFNQRSGRHVAYDLMVEASRDRKTTLPEITTQFFGGDTTRAIIKMTKAGLYPLRDLRGRWLVSDVSTLLGGN